MGVQTLRKNVYTVPGVSKKYSRTNLQASIPTQLLFKGSVIRSKLPFCSKKFSISVPYCFQNFLHNVQE